jgi:hypothetical protein
MIPVIKPIDDNRPPACVDALVKVDGETVAGYFSVSEPTARAILSSMWNYEQALRAQFEKSNLYEVTRKIQDVFK